MSLQYGKVSFLTKLAQESKTCSIQSSQAAAPAEITIHPLDQAIEDSEATKGCEDPRESPLYANGMEWLQGYRPERLLLEWRMAEDRKGRRQEGAQQGQKQRQERWGHRISCLLFISAVLFIGIYAVCGLAADQGGGGCLPGRAWLADLGGGGQGAGEWSFDTDSGRAEVLEFPEKSHAKAREAEGAACCQEESMAAIPGTSRCSSEVTEGDLRSRSQGVGERDRGSNPGFGNHAQRNWTFRAGRSHYEPRGTGSRESRAQNRASCIQKGSHRAHRPLQCLPSPTWRNTSDTCWTSVQCLLSPDGRYERSREISSSGTGGKDEDPTWGRPRQRAEPPKGCIAISGIEWLGRAFENGILGRNPGDCPFWSLFGSSSRTTLAAWSFSESVSSGFPSGYPGAWNYGVGPFVGLNPMPCCFNDAIKSDGSIDGVLGARFERATDYFGSFVDWLRAACYQTAVHQNPYFGAFTYAVGRMTSFSWIAGAASLALCCGWLMIKSLLIFHKKIYLSPLRGLRDEKLLIQWYLNLLATTMAFIYQWVWTANWLLGTEFLLDGVHIRPRAATMQGGMFLAVFLGLLLLARFCITFRIDSLKGCRKVGMTRLKPIRHHRSDSKRMSLFLLFNILGAQATQGHQVFPWGVEQPSSSIGDHLQPLTFMQLNHEMNNYHHVSSFSADWMRRDDNSGCPREAKLRRSFCILPSHYHTADLPESRLRDAVVGRFWASPGTNLSLSCGGGAAAVAQEDIFSKH